jgi:hypothetical protein
MRRKAVLTYKWSHFEEDLKFAGLKRKTFCKEVGNLSVNCISTWKKRDVVPIWVESWFKLYFYYIHSENNKKSKLAEINALKKRAKDYTEAEIDDIFKGTCSYAKVTETKVTVVEMIKQWLSRKF